MKQKLLISFSGGRTSAFMTYWLLNEWKDRHHWEMIVVFANTGKEREETLQFVNNCDQHFGFNTVWLEAQIHAGHFIGTTYRLTSYQAASRDGKPFEEMMRKYGLPNQSYPHCTRELKLQPIKAYAREIGWGDYTTALGIRSDEPKRLDWEKSKKNKLLYFAQLRHVTKSDVNKFWSKLPFDLQLKSFEGNCDLCWKKSMRKLMTIVKDKPELASWWREMEQQFGSFRPVTRVKKNGTSIEIEEYADGTVDEVEVPKFRFYREYQGIDDIIEESKQPFEPARDESKDIDAWKQTAFWEYELDSNSGCTESCEVF